ncbi:MAG: GNAT family N-acetyltransferase [Rhodospirillaceae bacterium]|nr:GNAT family N-acetyltransferase [Rhodospirillaceae bacterium]
MLTKNINLSVAQVNELNLVEKWLGVVHVKRWWNKEWASDIINTIYRFKAAGDYNNLVYIIASADQNIGLIHVYSSLKVKPDYIDTKELSLRYLIGEKDYLNRNLGSSAIKSVIGEIFKNKEKDRIISEPQADNWPAIISLQRAGFRNRGRVSRPGFNLVQLTFSRSLLSKK